MADTKADDKADAAGAAGTKLWFGGGMRIKKRSGDNLCGMVENDAAICVQSMAKIPTSRISACSHSKSKCGVFGYF